MGMSTPYPVYLTGLLHLNIIRSHLNHINYLMSECLLQSQIFLRIVLYTKVSSKTLYDNLFILSPNT